MNELETGHDAAQLPADIRVGDAGYTPDTGGLAADRVTPAQT
jgi:hypothetical protein